MRRHNRTGRSKGKLPPFVPLVKETMKTPAWRAMSHGARSLYVRLKTRYNTKLQNSVYLSTRAAMAELGSHSRLENIRRWFRELEYYGFIVLVRPGALGVEGRGKAPVWRLTEHWHLGQPPTRNFHVWDGVAFRKRKPARLYLRNKNRIPSRHVAHPEPACGSPKAELEGGIWNK
jgi:hypothetical protein